MGDRGTHDGGWNGSSLLERDDELGLFDEALRSAQDGVGAAVLVEGEAGIGRTALLAQLRSRGTEVLHARASPLEREFSFAVARQLFEARLLAASDDERDALLAGQARLAAPLFEADAMSAPSGTEYELLQGLHRLCANVAGEGPLLVAIDDLQWADGPSLRFAHYLLSRLEELPVLVALARCTGEPAAQPELLAAIAAAPVTHVVRPQPLTVAAVATLAARIEPGDRTADADPDTCHRMTGGNPSLLRALLDERAAGDGAAPADAGPRAVALDVMPRLERCAPDAIGLARAVAVLRPAAHLRHAAALAGLDEPAALRSAGALADYRVLRFDGTWSFVHPIVRNAVYESVSTADRARAHAHAAELLAADDAAVEQVAWHLARTAPACDAGTVQTLRQAAADALADGRPADAAAYLRRALDEQVDVDRAGALEQLGRAEIRLSQPARAAERLTAALDEIDDQGRRADVGLDLGRALVMSGRCREAVAVLGGLIGELREAGRDARRLEAELTVALPVDGRDRTPVTGCAAQERALAADDDAATRVLLANEAFEAAVAGGDARRAARLARRALEGGVLLEAEGSESLHPYRAAWTLALCDELDEADEALRVAASGARLRGSRLGMAAAACFASAVLARRGRLADADASAERALAVAREGWRAGMPLAAAFRTAVLVERDELADAEELAEACGVAQAIPGSAGARLVRYERGRLRVAQGRLEEGLEDLLRAADALPARNVPGTRVGAWHAEVAATLGRLERPDEAQDVAREGLERARTFGAPSAIGAALRALGLVECRAGAPKLLEEAVTALRRTPARLELARALVELGADLRRRNRRSVARRELRAGLELAGRCG
ncbi:MAG: AAA family ATPase, partial [Solirubrobacteraceae bacterium]|nr:AAA family ATPase [Solirubrobacteraceae bacterium]